MVRIQEFVESSFVVSCHTKSMFIKSFELCVELCSSL